MTPAQRYFATFSPEDQASIIASWGGQDRKEQWFANAVAAGAVNADGSPIGSITPQALRAKAKAEGWSEDFARPEFTDAVLQGWIDKYWDAKAGKFRSARGAEGLWEKPTECPDGQSPSGPDEDSPCKPTADLLAAQGPQASATDADTTEGSEISYTGNPLVDMLIWQFNTRKSMDFYKSGDPNIFGLSGGRTVPSQDGAGDVTGRLLKGGGLWWAPTKDAKDVFGSATQQSAQPKKTSAASAPEASVTPPQPPPPAEETQPPVPPPYEPRRGEDEMSQLGYSSLSPLQQLLRGHRKNGSFATEYGNLFA